MMKPRFVQASMMTVDQPSLVTLPSVELLEVGEDWMTSTGQFTWTSADLQSAIMSQDDPFVRTPVIKLGHTDPRFDGQPTLGRIENLRLSSNQQTLLGDLVGIPLWLANCMASAFPRRSIEGYFEYQTRGGNDWPFVLTGLALLGEAYPAIDSLEDVKALFGGEPPVLVPVEENDQMLATGEHSPKIAIPLMNKPLLVAASTPTVVMADASVDDVRNAFYEGPGADPDKFWWWIREVRIDPSEIIVDNDGGDLYRIPYTIDAKQDGDDAVTFGEPQQVRIQYIDVAASGQSVVTKFGNPVAAGRPRVRVTVNSSEKEGTEMQLSDEVLQGLGLTAEATDEEVNAALLARLNTPPVVETPPVTEITPPAPVADVIELPTAATGPTIPDGMALIDQATLDELKRGAQTAASLQTERDDRNRNRALDDAIKAGKFPPARRAHYEALLKADPEGGAATIASLADGLIPVTEAGTESGTEVDAAAEMSKYPDGWKPLVAAAQSASTASRVKVGAD